jgi:hypothetical protein
MALGKPDREWLKTEVATAVDAAIRALKPTGWKRVFHWLREWGMVPLVIGTLLTLFLTFVNRRADDARFQQKTEDRLGHTEGRLTEIAKSQQHAEDRLVEIEKSLARLTALVEASKPGFGNRLPTLLKESLRDAGNESGSTLPLETARLLSDQAKERKPPGDPHEIGSIGQGFVRLASTNQNENSAIPVVSALMAYRSSLLPEPAPIIAFMTAHAAMDILKDFVSIHPIVAAPQILGVLRLDRPSGRPRNPTFADIRRIESSPFPGAAIYSALVVDGYELDLDGLWVQNVLFRNCTIIYDGSPVVLSNVFFRRCNFRINNKGLALANTIFSSADSVTYK